MVRAGSLKKGRENKRNHGHGLESQILHGFSENQRFTKRRPLLYSFGPVIITSYLSHLHLLDTETFTQDMAQGQDFVVKILNFQVSLPINTG
jgi:hypothetical protein